MQLICKNFVIALIRTYFTPCSSVSIVNFEQVNAGWEGAIYENITKTERTSLKGLLDPSHLYGMISLRLRGKIYQVSC